MDSPCSNRCNMKVSMTTWLSQKDLRLVGHEILWFFKWKLSDYSAQYRMHDNSTMQIWSKVIKEKILVKKKKKSSKEKYYLVTLEGIKIYTTKAVKMSGETRYFTPLFYIQSNYSSPKSKFQWEFWWNKKTD